MTKTNGKYESKICPGCYSANHLNMYPGLKRKMERMVPLFPEELEKDCQHVRSLGIEQVRAYSFGDFHPDDVSLIKILPNYFRTYMFSKTIMLHPDCLAELANIPNLFISLSFNRNFMRPLEKMKDLVLREEVLNVAFNYTFLRGEDYFNSPTFQVFFSVSQAKKDKEKMLEVIPEHKICLDACLTCSKCDVGYIDLIGWGPRGSRREDAGDITMSVGFLVLRVFLILC